MSGVTRARVRAGGGGGGGGGGGDARIELMTKPSPESFQWMYSLQASSCRMFHSVSSHTVILAGRRRAVSAAAAEEEAGVGRRGPGLRREEARVPARVAGERRGEETGRTVVGE